MEYRARAVRVSHIHSAYESKPQKRLPPLVSIPSPCEPSCDPLHLHSLRKFQTTRSHHAAYMMEYTVATQDLPS
jgi:hypothetical protein